MNYWVCKGRAANEFKSFLRPGRIATWHTATPEEVVAWRSHFPLGEQSSPSSGRFVSGAQCRSRSR